MGVCGNVCYAAAVVKDRVLSLIVLKYVVCLCKICDGCCVFCLYCDAWSCRCSCMGSMSVSSCRCCIFVTCMHPVAVLNAAFCMTFSLFMLVEDASGDHMEEAYSRAGLMTALYVDMSGSFCLHHRVAVSAMSFGSKVRHRTFGCVPMGSAVLFILRSRLHLYSAGSGVNRVPVVLSGFCVRLFCFVQAKRYVGMVVCISLLLSCLCV